MHQYRDYLLLPPLRWPDPEVSEPRSWDWRSQILRWPDLQMTRSPDDQIMRWMDGSMDGWITSSDACYQTKCVQHIVAQMVKDVDITTPFTSVAHYMITPCSADHCAYSATTCACSVTSWYTTPYTIKRWYMCYIMWCTSCSRCSSAHHIIRCITLKLSACNSWLRNPLRCLHHIIRSMVFTSSDPPHHGLERVC